MSKTRKHNDKIEAKIIPLLIKLRSIRKQIVSLTEERDLITSKIHKLSLKLK